MIFSDGALMPKKVDDLFLVVIVVMSLRLSYTERSDVKTAW